MNQTIKDRIAKINNGQVPEGYKYTEVGIVPYEWEEHVLDDYFDFKNGLNKEKEAFGSGTPIVNYTDVWGKRGLRKSDIKGKVKLSAKEISNYNALEGDVFFTRTSETKNEIGLSSVLLDHIDDCVFSGFVLRARPKKKGIVKEYNQYCYSSELMRYEIIRKSSITTRALTNGKLLGQVKINLPSEQEQSRIAQILMQWDKTIELQEKYIASLENRKKALMQRLLTPKGGWKKTKLSSILKERCLYNIKNNDYTHVTLGKSGIVDKTEQFDRDFLVKDENKSYKITRYNDLCYNPANLKFGVICLNKYGDAIFSPIYITFEIDNKFNPDFIGAVLSSNNFINYIRKYEEGTVYERQAVKPSDFILGEIFVPSIEIQNYIAKCILIFDQEISLQKQKLQKLIAQRKALMQVLLTGIVRVV